MNADNKLDCMVFTGPVRKCSWWWSLRWCDNVQRWCCWWGWHCDDCATLHQYHFTGYYNRYLFCTNYWWKQGSETDIFMNDDDWMLKYYDHWSLIVFIFIDGHIHIWHRRLDPCMGPKITARPGPLVLGLARPAGSTNYIRRHSGLARFRPAKVQAWPSPPPIMNDKLFLSLWSKTITNHWHYVH